MTAVEGGRHRERELNKKQICFFWLMHAPLFGVLREGSQAEIEFFIFPFSNLWGVLSISTSACAVLYVNEKLLINESQLPYRVFIFNLCRGCNIS